MSLDKSKKISYEDLVKAMGEGEFGMTKFIWSVCQKVDRISEQVPMDLEKFQEKFDKFIAEYQEPQDGEPGKDGSPGPAGPEGKQGPEGKPGKEGPAGNDGADGFPGARGEKGPEGRMGRMPAHEWDGTKIRFQIPLGWGPWVDLQGPIGRTGQSMGPSEGVGTGGSGALEWVRDSSGVVAQGVAGITFGANLTVTRQGNGVLVEATGGGGTPGGSDTQVQFNDGGSFGGDANYTWDKTQKTLTVQGVTDGAGTNTQVWRNLSSAIVARVENNGDGYFNGITASALGTGVVHATSGTFSIALVDMGTEVTATLFETNGGTGQSSYAVGDMLYASSTTGLSKLPIAADGTILALASGIPAWTTFSTILDPAYIRLDGTTTTSAKIPFAQGVSLPDLETIDFGVISYIYTDGIDTYIEANPSNLTGANVLISPGQNISDAQAGSVYLYGAPSTGDTPNLNGAVYIGNSPVAEPVGALGSHGTDMLGVGGYLAVNGYSHFRGNIFVGTNSGISAGVANIALDGNAARSIGVEKAAGLVSAGQALGINAGGSKTGTTNQNGGNLTLSPGAATGTGTASTIIQATGGGSSGTANRAPSTVLTFAITTGTFVDAYNLAFGTATGSKFGTSTSQKLGFFNATPIVQVAATTDLGTVLSNLGFRAAGTAYPMATSGTVDLTGTFTANTLALKAGASAGNIAKVGGTNGNSFADVSVGGAEADIFTYTTPASSLNTNGDGFTGTYAGNFVTVGTELTQLKVYFGGTAIWDSTGVAPTTGTTSWRVTAEIIRVSSTVIRYTVTLNTTGASGFVYCTVGELTGLTLSNTNILKITGTSSGVGSGAGDIVGKMSRVEWLAAA